jgi:hypothetical protein
MEAEAAIKEAFHHQFASSLTSEQAYLECRGALLEPVRKGDLYFQNFSPNKAQIN